MEKVSYDPTTKTVIAQFQGFLTNNEFVSIAEKTHATRVQNRCYKQLNNIENMAVLSKENQEYAENVWFPKAVKTGLKFFAFVVPKQILGQLSMQKVNKNAEREGAIQIKYFDNQDEALNWLKVK